MGGAAKFYEQRDYLPGNKGMEVTPNIGEEDDADPQMLPPAHNNSNEEKAKNNNNNKKKTVKI